MIIIADAGPVQVPGPARGPPGRRAARSTRVTEKLYGMTRMNSLDGEKVVELKSGRELQGQEAKDVSQALSSKQMTDKLANLLVRAVGNPGPPGSIKNKIVNKAIRKKLLNHPNQKNKDVVRSKWIRLLESRPNLYQYWNEVVEAGRHRELLRLDLSLLEKELGPTDQKNVMCAIMSMYLAGSPTCGDEILDGFEMVSGHNPYIRWRDGDRMMGMTCLRLEKLSIVCDDDFEFNIADSWDREEEDRDVILAWEHRASKWINCIAKAAHANKMECMWAAEEGDMKAKMMQVAGLGMEKRLRDFVGFVYVAQGNRLVALRHEVLPFGLSSEIIS
jgi:hypothetical protein